MLGSTPYYDFNRKGAFKQLAVPYLKKIKNKKQKNNWPFH